jgi:hypothetical protein
MKRQVEMEAASRPKLKRAVYDWKTEAGDYRHFYFDVQCVDTDGAVLALIDECQRLVGDLSGYTVYVRHAFTVQRGIREFGHVRLLANVRYRIGVNLKSRPAADDQPIMCGFGAPSAAPICDVDLDATG